MKANASNETIIRQLWALLGASRFDELAPLLAADVVCDWPLTGERIRGRGNYIAVNSAYPGVGRISIERLIADGDRVVTQSRVEWNGSIDYAISFFELKDGLVIRQVDWWPQQYEAPAWRSDSPWIESMPSVFESGGTP